MLYVVPSTVSISPSLVHVTVVAGEPVEVQVRVRASDSYVRLDTVGGAEKHYISKHHKVRCYTLARNHTCTPSKDLHEKLLYPVLLTRKSKHIRVISIRHVTYSNLTNIYYPLTMLDISIVCLVNQCSGTSCL